MRVKKKALEKILEKVPSFSKPKLKYEQYTIPSWLAADLLWIAETSFGDIYEMKILDLGTGTGRLALGAALMGADYVVGVDIDLDVIKIARTHVLRNFPQLTNLEFLCADINNFNLGGKRKFDTVIQNPPFGVHRKGYDIMFLRNALKLAKVVYTMHKSKTRDFLLSFLNKHYKCKVIILFKVKFPLPPTYKFHEKRIHLVDVDVIRVELT